MAASSADTIIDVTDGSQPVADRQDVRYLIDPVDGAKLVTAPDAARLMGAGLRTVHGWVARGLVEVRRTPSGQARIVVSSLWKRCPAGDAAAQVSHPDQEVA